MDPRIAWAIAEIEQQIGSDLAIADLARRVHLSRSRFTHLFRDATGMSPVRYRQARRMARARLLLESTFLSVKEVMATVGFNDPSHFARDFRRYNGTGPRAWRSAARRSPPASVAADYANKQV